MRLRGAMVAALLVAACGEVRDEVVSVETISPTAPVEDSIDESIQFASRGELAYGLPREGQAAIADLVALFPTDPTGVNDPDIFVAPGIEAPTESCRGGRFGEVPELPMEIEGIVTLHPRQYMKVPICGQDERHYGVYTIEDDTGGVVVLRDSRVAPFSFGDRIRLRVEGIMLTFGLETDTRAVLISDYTVLDDPPPSGDGIAEPGTVLYAPTTEPFGDDDVTRVREIEGFVYDVPTNDNFNSMVITAREIPPNAGDALEGEQLTCVRSCQLPCRSLCNSGNVCEGMCRDICADNGNTFVEDELGACWNVGIDSELGRRGFQPEFGRHVRIRGPVVNSFDVQIWVNSLGQTEFLDSAEF